jgi:hypothetical protein
VTKEIKKKTYLKKKDNTTERSAGTTRRKWAQDKYIHCIQTKTTPFNRTFKRKLQKGKNSNGNNFKGIK